MFQTAVLTISDRSFAGVRPDSAGPLVVSLLTSHGYQVTQTLLLPDEQAEIEAALCRLADSGDFQLLVTTGGTGFSPRDVTPEATLAVCDRMTPGIPETMRLASMQITPRAMLSRAQAGGHALPGAGRHPQGDPDFESPRLTQSGPGKSGGGPSRPGPRAGNALRPAGGLGRPTDGICLSTL